MTISVTVKTNSSNVNGLLVTSQVLLMLYLSESPSIFRVVSLASQMKKPRLGQV